MICTQCIQDLPDDCVSELASCGTDGQLIYRLLCACCALELCRTEHHDPNFIFHGTKASDMLRRCQAAKERRKAPTS